MTTATAQTAANVKTDAGIDVQCAGLTKIFKDFWMRNRVTAVDHIDLEIRHGEVFGLLGPNGSGKSTTIKMILGLLHITRGRISVFGRRPDDVAIKKQIGYLPEESYLYRFLNARETLDYYGRLFYQSRKQRMQRIDMLLDMVGLTSVQRRPIGEYSKGMQRRIGLAQALINDPQLLILDEPTTGMDPIGSRQIKDLIIQLGERGKTVLLCSHMLSDVEDTCGRVAIMFGGKVRAQGTVGELLMKQDQTTIETNDLDDETIREIEAVLAKHGKQINSVDHPRQKLESLFLDIVAKAEAEGAATSGASGGGRIADFLVDGGGDAEKPAGVVDELLAKPKPAPTPQAPEAEATAAPTPPADGGVLDDLVSGSESKKPAQPPAPAKQPETDSPKNPDSSVLDDLMGPKKDE